MRGMVKAAYNMPARGRSVIRSLSYALALLLAGCQSAPSVRVVTCPPIPASLTRDCGRCLADDPTPATNGELAEAWMDCRACVFEFRIRMSAVRELSACRIISGDTTR